MDKNKDWTGNAKTTFVTLGASNHSKGDRQQHDFYATDPVAIELLKQTPFFDENVKTIWEPACGSGHLVEPLLKDGYTVYASDLYNYGYDYAVVGHDFLQDDPLENVDAIITNPPYKDALEFCERAVAIAPKVAMFLKLTFLEGAKRQEFFKKNPPKYVAVCTNRVQCALNGDPEMFAKSSAACYAWFIWDRTGGGTLLSNPQILWTEKPKTNS